MDAVALRLSFGAVHGVRHSAATGRRECDGHHLEWSHSASLSDEMASWRHREGKVAVLRSVPQRFQKDLLSYVRQRYLLSSILIFGDPSSY